MLFGKIIICNDICNYLFFTFSGHVMGPPLRPDPTTPGFLMDLLAKWVLSLLAFFFSFFFFLSYFLLSNSWQNVWKTFESWLLSVWQPVFRRSQVTYQRPFLNLANSSSSLAIFKHLAQSPVCNQHSNLVLYVISMLHVKLNMSPNLGQASN